MRRSLSVLDVVSLYTNILTDLAVEVAHKRPWEDDCLEDRTSLEVDETVIQALPLNATFICFRGKYYRYTFGTTIGSPVSVMVTNWSWKRLSRRHYPPTFHHLFFGRGMWTIHALPSPKNQYRFSINT